MTEAETRRIEKRERASKLNEEKHSRKLKLGPLLDPELHTNGSWSEFKDVESVWQLLLGFANATQISFGGNRSECQFGIEAIIDSSVFATQMAQEKWPNYWNVLKAIDGYLMVPYSLYGLTYGCYWGVLEIVDVLTDYFIFHKDAKILAFNVGYNAGAIITGIKNIWMWNVAKEYTRVSDAFTMGLEIGQLWWSIFYPAEQYLDQNLGKLGTLVNPFIPGDNEEWKWGQDYTWDAILHRRVVGPDEVRSEPVMQAPVPTEDHANTGFGEFLARHLPSLKAKALAEPQPPNHDSLRAKMAEHRSRNINDSNRPWHLVFLSGLANRFFE